VGIGADEQCAGYGRHRTTFLRAGAGALEAELDMDCRRLWERNLGRDDRCVGDSGREAWFPYLDEGVVRVLQSLPVGALCDLDRPPGEGDKLVVRGVAGLLGLTATASLVKRAIQFGTKIAKLTNIACHGSNRKGKGDTRMDEG
jgi:asparagine synthetase B (glutamine-hydrolysing)